MIDDKADFVSRLYQRYWSKLDRRLKGMVQDADAADIAQDSFVRVSAMEGSEKLEHPYAYLYRTAVNLIKDRAKAQKVRTAYQEVMTSEEEGNVEFLSPEHHLMARRRLERVSRAVDKLPERCRQVFLLHRVHNLSHKEISSALGITTAAVEKHIMRALARCQGAFENDE